MNVSVLCLNVRRFDTVCCCLEIHVAFVIMCLYVCFICYVLRDDVVVCCIWLLCCVCVCIVLCCVVLLCVCVCVFHMFDCFYIYITHVCACLLMCCPICYIDIIVFVVYSCIIFYIVVLI